MTSPILFAGGEDLDFTFVNGSSFGVLNSTPNLNPDGTMGILTGANSFRSGFSRLAMTICARGGDVSHYLRASFAATTSFWTSFRCNYETPGSSSGGTISSIPVPFRLVDSSGLVRILVKFAGVASAPNDTFKVFTQNAVGTQVQIGSTSTGPWDSVVASSGGTWLPVADKIDVFVNYAVAGQITIYQNGTQVFNFSGDVTTNSVTTLAGVDLGFNMVVGNNIGGFTAYSEVIVSTNDTRNFSMVTQVSTANGNTHNFDGGTAANLASTNMFSGDSSPNYASSAGLIQEYQVTPAMPAGGYAVISVVHKARLTIGTTGPAHAEFMVRTGAADFTSTPDAAPSTGWSTFIYNWDLNPNTSAPWLTTELPASSTAFNMGLKAIT